MLIRGTRFDDWLWNTTGDDQIYGLTGNDRLEGNIGDDRLYGGRGDDRLSDAEGTDRLHGGDDNDWLEANAIDYRSDGAWGGNGNDLIFGGTGFDLLVGGQGDDYISGMGGQYHGDQGPGARYVGSGNDSFYTNLGNDYGTARIMTGGLGADGYLIDANPEGVATAVTITDFKNGEDRLEFHQIDQWGPNPLLTRMDSDRNGQLDASDGWSAAGNVTATDHSLTLTVADGDSITLLNNTHLDYVF